MLFEELLKRKQMLERVLEINEQNNISIYGRFRIDAHHGKPQYYHCLKTGDTKGKFLKKDEREIAAHIAQYQYDQKIKGLAQKQLKKVNELIKVEMEDSMTCAFEKINPFRKELIKPYRVSNETYAKNWQCEKYESNSFMFDREYSTARGDKVRSKSEVIIANYLYSENIPYKYEYPLRLKKRTVYADFATLNVRTRQEFALEHFGMLDNEKYLMNALSKIDEYIESGYIPGKNLILTFEYSGTDFNINNLKTLVDEHLK